MSSRRIPSQLLVLLALSYAGLLNQTSSQAQTTAAAHTESLIDDWDRGLTSFERFRAYPHVDAGLRAGNANDLDTAHREFEKALQLAPSSTPIALYLAQTLARMKRFDEAIALLNSKINQESNATALQAQIQEYERQRTQHIIAQAQSMAGSLPALKQFLVQAKPDLYSAFAETQWLELLATASDAKQNMLAGYHVKFASNWFEWVLMAVDVDLKHHDLPAALHFLKANASKLFEDFKQVQTLKYHLTEQGYPDLALTFLLQGFPYEGLAEHQRDTVIQDIGYLQSMVAQKTIVSDFLSQHAGPFESAQQEKIWYALADINTPAGAKLLTEHSSQYAQNQPLESKDILDQILNQPTGLTSAQLFELLKKVPSLPGSFLEIITYRLMQAGEDASALRLLMSAYPFAEVDETQRTALLERISILLRKRPEDVTPAMKQALATPLSSPNDRRLQASIMSQLGDCNAVRRILGDYAPGYTALDYLMLGNCLQHTNSGLAQLAYERAFTQEPTVFAARSVAYIAFQNHDYQASLKAWDYVLSQKNASSSDLLAASVSALAAGRPSMAKTWLQTYETLKYTKTATYWRLYAQAIYPDDPDKAIKALLHATAMEPEVADYLKLAQWYLKSDREQEALDALLAAQKLDPADGAVQAELGFLTYRLNQLPQAQQHMLKALQVRPRDIKVIDQLAYIDQRLGENEQAKKYIRLSVDHDLRYGPDEVTPELEEKVFAMRRMYEDLSRRWTLTVDAMSATDPTVSILAPEPGQSYQSYSQIELDYRLGDPAIDNGRTLSLYGRVFGGGGADNSALPIYAPTLGIGLRWKPFSEHVFYLSIEKQFPLDQGTSPPENTMIRASASFLNDGKFSDDWHPVGPGWLSQNLYLDAAYYLENQSYSLTADYRIGYHKKIQQGQTIQPYVRLVANKVDSQPKADVRAGFGVRWNLWSHESRYSAYSSKSYIGVEMQYALESVQSNRLSAVLTMGTKW